MRWYLAGPMGGIPQHNIPAFDAAAATLRAAGFDVVSPAELDDPETRAKALASHDGASCNGQTWGDFLARDVKLIADNIDGIILLPGWQKSRGARLEVLVGLLCGHSFSLFGSESSPVIQVSPRYIRAELKRSMP